MAELMMLRLEGLLQSWGESSAWDNRGTASIPTKSGIVGLLACAMGLHRTDIAIALYYVFHPSVPCENVPEMRGHRKNGQFNYERIPGIWYCVKRSRQPERKSPESIRDFHIHRKNSFSFM